jgi:hypothetical protein
VSHHLAKLLEVGLVCRRVVGTTHLYSLDSERLGELSRMVATAGGLRALSSDVDESTYERKVLRAFTDGETLVQIPASLKKRQVILRWLAGDFEHGRRYPEKEVNELLQRHHWDSATLRRELVASRLMARERGVYWRL